MWVPAVEALQANVVLVEVIEQPAQVAGVLRLKEDSSTTASA